MPVALPRPPAYPVRQHVARVLAELLRARGMDAQRLSRASGVAQQVIEDYLRAEREINFALLRPMARAMGVPLMALFEPVARAKKT